MAEVQEELLDDYVVVDKSFFEEEEDENDFVPISNKSLKGFYLYLIAEKIRAKLLRPLYRVNIDLSFKALSELEKDNEDN